MSNLQIALAEMNARLHNVEGGLVQLRDEVRESGDRQQAILVAMQQHAEAMREDSVAMWREVGRHTAQFDQVNAYMVDNLQHYQGNVGKIMGMIIERDAEQAARHDALARRVDAIERKLAG